MDRDKIEDNISLTAPIRVLQVVTQMDRNGLESRIMDIYRNIDKTKIQFDFLTHRKEKGQFDAEIQSLGGNIYYLNPIKPQHFFRYLKDLNDFFMNHNYRIVHAHLNAYCTWVLLIAKKHGVQMRIAHSRNSGMDHNWKAIFKFASKIFVNVPTTHKLACSNQAGEWLFGKKGIKPPNRFLVLPNGFNLSRFTYSEEKRIFTRTRYDLRDHFAVVHVGRLTYQKNHIFLLNVFEKILELKKDAELFLVGEGELETGIRNSAIEKNINQKVHFLGNISNVGDVLQGMDVMIFPSIYEGFGTAVIESQCIGLPTLASDVLPKETKITECLEFASIKKDSYKKWAYRIVEMYDKIPRIDRSLEVKQAGYDIQDTYSILTDLYQQEM